MMPVKPFLELTAADLMTRDVITIPQSMSLRDAARVLHQAGVGGAPVVDELGRCVGVVSGFDFVRWAEGADPEVKSTEGRVCPYLRKGNPASGSGDWICVLAAGGCPFQSTRPTTAGRHISVCLRPQKEFSDWHRMTEGLPVDAVRRYMTTDVVTVSLETRLAELAQKMVDAHIHRLIVVDDSRRPVGIISSTSLMAALARAGAQTAMASTAQASTEPAVVAGAGVPS
jgi:CBS-domain-containing membrane protein